jgi:hypothetical protein
MYRYSAFEAEVDAFQSRNDVEFLRLDKGLETTIGKKERVIGAFYQHRKDHGLSGVFTAAGQHLQ